MDSVAGPSRRTAHTRREGGLRPTEDPSPRIAHTLTACCRCRTRKTRCDPGLPRCGPCERTNQTCEYFDPAKGTRIKRDYVVHLQHRVRELEQQLADLDVEDAEPDPEDEVRKAASVRMQDGDESKFLGPSSGIAITRLVMQLAKQFTDSKSISEIVPDARAKQIKERFAVEEAKPTSKIYPLISDVAAEELPNRGLTDLLVQLFYVKVHAMYPIFHEPTFTQDVEAVYNGSIDAFQNFAVRMVIAISLQRMDTHYAGLADSYYLAALKHLENAVRPMNLKTLQCFALIAGYSLLTPTRTAVYYVIGLAVRLTQALGLNEEKTITKASDGQPANPLVVDMRRRVFWVILVMECGLSHSLGRPCILATRQEHIDVDFFECVDDEYITPNGILPAPQPSLKKWIAIHFFKMRLLQLEIRRKLYQRKRSEPKDDQDLWFQQMEAKLIAWRDASPTMDAGSGLNKVWFTGRYNTMVVFLFRPSPQVPRPSLRAAKQCYDACQFNIHMQRRQIATRSVELTWIFTQSLFMNLNTMLWTLSYCEIRRLHPREEVRRHMDVSLEAISIATERWPGVASAHELYINLVDACMKIYDKDGDFPIAAGSPADSTMSPNTMDGPSRSRTASPATVSTQSVTTPPEKPQPPFGYILPQHYAASPEQSKINLQPSSSPPIVTSPPAMSPSLYHMKPAVTAQLQPQPDPASHVYHNFSKIDYDPSSHFNPLPSTFTDLGSWNPRFMMSQPSGAFEMPTSPPMENSLPEDPNGYPMPYNNVEYSDYLYPQSWAMERPGMGLNQTQQIELMQSLETSGTNQIESMIQQSNALFYPQNRGY